MSKKSPPQRDIDRIRGMLESDQGPDSADLAWAREVLEGKPVSPPGEALRPEVAYALVEVLVARKDADSLGILAQSDHRTVSKAARTALHRLRSQRVEVEVPAQPTGPSGTGQPIQQELPSLVTIYDSRWERLIWIGQEAPSGVQVFHARVSASSGLVDFRSGSTSRKEYRSKSKDIREKLGGELIETDLAIWFLQQAAQRCHQVQRALPDTYAKASQLLESAQERAHPALSVEPSREVDLAIFELQELRYWLPKSSDLRRLQLQLDEVATSRLMINEQQRLDQVSNILTRFLEEYFTTQRRESCRQILLDTVHLLEIKGDRDRAADLRAAADLFELPVEQLLAHPLPRRFVERVVNPDWIGANEEPPDGTKTPGESGLIIPG
jgi:hypothetical protein